MPISKADSRFYKWQVQKSLRNTSLGEDPLSKLLHRAHMIAPILIYHDIPPEGSRNGLVYLTEADGVYIFPPFLTIFFERIS